MVDADLQGSRLPIRGGAAACTQEEPDGAEGQGEEFRRAAPEATAWDGSSTISTRYCAAGSATSSTRHRASSAPSTASSADGSAQSGASRRRVPASGDAKRITSGGRMPSSLNMGCSPYRPPMHGRDTPDEETSDWRAVCGKTARTVRRAGCALKAHETMSPGMATAAKPSRQPRTRVLRGVR